jgi:hypothetical protein
MEIGAKEPALDGNESFVYWSMRNYISPFTKDEYEVPRSAAEVNLLKKIRSSLADTQAIENLVMVIYNDPDLRTILLKNIDK